MPQTDSLSNGACLDKHYGQIDRKMFGTTKNYYFGIMNISYKYQNN